MTDFETHPIGTAKEIERLQYHLDWHQSETALRDLVIDQQSKEIKRLQAALERIQAADAATAWQLRGMANEALKSGGNSE